MKNIIDMPKNTGQKARQASKYEFDFPQDGEEQVHKRKLPGFSLPAVNLDWLNIAARSACVCLLLFGLWAGMTVLLEAIQLYRDPARIESFAIAIENGSNIDKSLAPANNAAISGQNDFRLSYFAAWGITLLLLLLISMIAFAAIRTGGELVLYDAKMKRFAKKLLKESNKK